MFLANFNNANIIPKTLYLWDAIKEVPSGININVTATQIKYSSIEIILPVIEHNAIHARSLFFKSPQVTGIQFHIFPTLPN